MVIFLSVMLIASIKYHPYHLIVKLTPFLNEIAVRNLKEVWDNGALTFKGKEFGIPQIDNLAKSYKLKEVRRLLYGKITEDAKSYGLDRYYLLIFEDTINAFYLKSVLSQIKGIESVELDEAKPVFAVPNDPRYSQQWHLPKIKAPEGWDITKGDSTIVIGPVDSGVDWDHEDLWQKVWQNLGEDADGDGHVIELQGGIPVFDPDDINGVDDDGNGYVDDFIGWDFMGGDNDPTPTESGNDHGTHVFGIAVAATDNGIGVASVGWKVKGMAFKCGDGQYIYTSYAVNAIYYAGNMGAVATNHSYGSYYQNTSERNAMIWAHDSRNVTICAAAGNDNVQTPLYPANYPNVIAVAATNQGDIKSSYSNYGTWVDVSSPGDYIISTTPNNGYAGFYGTSMASPIVCGIAGMVRSLHPTWTSYQVDSIIMRSCDNIDSLNPNYQGLLGWGRVNLYRALAQSIYSNIIVTDFKFDGDGRPEPGEVVRMYLKLYNKKYWQDASNINITVSTSDPNISFSDNSISVSYLANGDSVLTTDYFEFSVSGDIRFTYFTINITSTPQTEKPADTLKVLIGYPGIVLVDDANSKYLRSFYESTLDNLGVIYDTWLVDRDGLQSFSLHPRELFIWFTGNDSTEVLSPEEIDSLNNYLSSGGGLFISSQFLAEDPDAQSFITNTLKAQVVAHDVGYGWIKGYDGDPIGDSIHSRISSGDGAQNAIDVDKITALTGADTSLYYSNPSGSANYGPCAVRYDSGNYKTLYFAFPFESVDNSLPGSYTKREDLMRKILEWFGIVGISENKPEISYRFLPSISKISRNYLLIKGIDTRYSLKIYNITGRRVLLLKGIEDNRIPIGLTRGIYFLYITSEKGQEYKTKFIVE